MTQGFILLRTSFSILTRGRASPSFWNLPEVS
jgi:hypothetical protein